MQWVTGYVCISMVTRTGAKTQTSELRERERERGREREREEPSGVNRDDNAAMEKTQQNT